MISEIAIGERNWSDILLLIAAIILFIEFLYGVARTRVATLPETVRLHLAAFGLIAIALLLL